MAYLVDFDLLPAAGHDIMSLSKKLLKTGDAGVNTVFKAVSLKESSTWAVVLTTKEGADHEIGGFASASAARAWIERETGNSLDLVEIKAA